MFPYLIIHLIPEKRRLHFPKFTFMQLFSNYVFAILDCPSNFSNTKFKLLSKRKV